MHVLSNSTKRQSKVQKMPNFLFWNTHGNRIYDQVRTLAVERNAALIILAECKLDIAHLVELLNRERAQQEFLNRERAQQYETSLGELSTRKLVFIHNSNEFHLIRDSSFGSFGAFNTGGGKEVIIAAIHFPSKRDRGDSDFRSYAKIFRNELEKIEQERGHSRSVIVGDFNMNPFEDGMIEANCLHAVMDSEIAKKKGRTVQGRFYKYLYNPMWGKMGDTSPGPPGTYFYNRAGQKNYFWHTFDQVLIRPDLIPDFTIDKLEVVESINETTLLTPSGRPRRSISDHLPIVFSIE